MARAVKQIGSDLPTGLDVAGFLAWEAGEPGRYELHDGEVFAKSPQRNRHTSKKGSVYVALRTAIARSDLPCHAMPDGVAVHLVHHKRQDDGTILARIVTAGPLQLDPPGLTVDLTEISS